MLKIKTFSRERETNHFMAIS